MAENENGQEKTEQPTPKKLREAKKKGQVPRSKDLNSMTVMVIGALGLLSMGAAMIQSISEMMKSGFTLTRQEILSPQTVLIKFEQGVLDALFGISPFLILMTLVVIFTPLMLGGWAFSIESMAFKGSRLNPLSGLKRIFSSKGLMELIKSLAKFLLVSFVAVTFLWIKADEFLGLGLEPLSQAFKHGALLFGQSFLVMSSSLILIAAIDVPFQLWDHSKNLKMTLQEIRDEMKDTEGKPEVKSKVRQLQQEMSQKRMMEDVPDADVIITNPTHYAVALKYNPEKMAVPIVVALGKDLIALRIREIASEHEIEIFEAPPLARALHANCRLKQEIPGHLFYAVAQVLAFVFQLRATKTQGLDDPDRPDPYLAPEQGV